MSSSRFPGKTLYPVNGKPLLGYLLERLSHAKHLDSFVVATSDQSSDDPIASFCEGRSVRVYRGALEDVAERFVGALKETGFDVFVRVSADSPLLDPGLIDSGVSLFLQGEFDLVTNVHPRTYPKGESIEVVRSSTYRAVYGEMTAPEDRENVTTYFYKNEQRLRICNFESGGDYGHIQLSVDTPEDMDAFTALIAGMERSHWEYPWEELIAIHDRMKSQLLSVKL